MKKIIHINQHVIKKNSKTGLVKIIPTVMS